MFCTVPPEPKNVEVPSTSGTHQQAVKSMGGNGGASSAVNSQQKHLIIFYVLYSSTGA